MGVEQQQGTGYQLSLQEWGEETVRHGVPGEGGTGTGAFEEQQATTASERKRALTGGSTCLISRGNRRIR